MENKKIIIITIVLFLIAGTGTFVFATSQGDIKTDDIDYRTDKEPTYQKVDTNNNSNNNANDSLENDNASIPNPGIIEDPTTSDNSNNSGNSNSSNTTKPGNSNNSSNSNTNGNINNRPGTSNPGGSGNNDNSNSSSGNEGNAGDNNASQPEEPSIPIINDTTPPILDVKYSETNNTKGPIIATITANEPIQVVSGWSISSDKLSLSRAFTSNENGTVTVYDEANNASTIDYNIQNIDNIAPSAIVSTSNNNGNKLTFRDIIVTITADEDIKPVSGWDLTDNRTLTKTFSNIANDEYSVKIYDLVGNEKEVKYEIRNYDPTSPEVIVNKDETEMTITMTYKEPLDESWSQNENGEYTKTETIPSNNDKTIFITMPDGTIKIYESAPAVNIYISNKNSDGTYEKTNKPVEVRLDTNKELQELESWNLSADRKALTAMIYEATANKKVTLTDLAGNTTTIKYTVSNIDTTAPGIKLAIGSKPSNGLITITLITTEPTIFEDESWSAQRVGGFASSYTKKISEEELINGVSETFNLKDRYDNESTIITTLKYLNGKIILEND